MYSSNLLNEVGQQDGHQNLEAMVLTRIPDYFAAG